MRGVTCILVLVALAHLFNVSNASAASHVCKARHDYHSSIASANFVHNEFHHSKHQDHFVRDVQDATTYVKSNTVYSASVICLCLDCICSLDLCGSAILLVPTLSIAEILKNRLRQMFYISEVSPRFSMRVFRPPKSP